MTTMDIQPRAAAAHPSASRIEIHAESQLMMARMFALSIAAFGLGDLAFGISLLTHGNWRGLLLLALLPLFVLGTVSANRAAIRGAPEIFATREGLEFISDHVHFYAWDEIRELTLVPYYSMTTSSMARPYEVNLVDGSTFRFAGRTDALKRIAKVSQRCTACSGAAGGLGRDGRPGGSA